MVLFGRSCAHAWLKPLLIVCLGILFAACSKANHTKPVTLNGLLQKHPSIALLTFADGAKCAFVDWTFSYSVSYRPRRENNGYIVQSLTSRTLSEDQKNLLIENGNNQYQFTPSELKELRVHTEKDDNDISGSTLILQNGEMIDLPVRGQLAFRANKSFPWSNTEVMMRDVSIKGTAATKCHGHAMDTYRLNKAYINRQFDVIRVEFFSS